MFIMGVVVSKYVDFLGRYAIYGENGYYVDPSILHRIIVDELKLSMSFNEIKEFVEKCEISLTEEEIREFLDKKMEEEEPNLQKEVEELSKTRSKNIVEWTEEDIHRVSRVTKNLIFKRRYEFDPYSLKYFRKYTSILKEKCKTLFEILENLLLIKEGQGSDESWNWVSDLDFHINEFGDLYMEDVVRLADAIVYNVRTLYNKIHNGNNLETYLTFKESKHSMGKDGVFGSELYPRREIQIKNLNYVNRPEFIALSEKQKQELESQKFDTLARQIYADFSEDDRLPDGSLQIGGVASRKKKK